MFSSLLNKCNICLILRGGHFLIVKGILRAWEFCRTLLECHHFQAFCPLERNAAYTRTPERLFFLPSMSSVPQEVLICLGFPKKWTCSLFRFTLCLLHCLLLKGFSAFNCNIWNKLVESELLRYNVLNRLIDSSMRPHK